MITIKLSTYFLHTTSNFLWLTPFLIDNLSVKCINVSFKKIEFMINVIKNKLLIF